MSKSKFFPDRNPVPSKKKYLKGTEWMGNTLRNTSFNYYPSSCAFSYPPALDDEDDWLDEEDDFLADSGSSVFILKNGIVKEGPICEYDAEYVRENKTIKLNNGETLVISLVKVKKK